MNQAMRMAGGISVPIGADGGAEGGVSVVKVRPKEAIRIILST